MSSIPAQFPRETDRIGRFVRQESRFLDHIKIHYYTTHLQLNPTGIIPAGPALDWDAPHGREALV